jgi:hypothetical protein
MEEKDKNSVVNRYPAGAMLTVAVMVVLIAAIIIALNWKK